MNTTMTKISNMALPKRENTRKVVVTGAIIVAILSCTYVYFVGKIVFDVVGRKTAEKDTRSIQSSVGILEAKYFAQLQSLDLTSLAEVGLQESHDTLYATRAIPATQASLTTPAL